MATNVRLSSIESPDRESTFVKMVKRRTANKSAIIQNLVDLVLAFEKANGRLPEWDRAELKERK